MSDNTPNTQAETIYNSLSDYFETKAAVAFLEENHVLCQQEVDEAQQELAQIAAAAIELGHEAGLIADEENSVEALSAAVAQKLNRPAPGL